MGIRVIECDVGGVKAGVGVRDSELTEAVSFQLSMCNLWLVLGIGLFQPGCGLRGHSRPRLARAAVASGQVDFMWPGLLQ